jgi:hypothetical protein
MLTLICGLPRAGKTTFSQRFKDVIHLDNSGAYHGVLRRLQHKRGDVIIEGVYDKRGYREQLIRTYKGEHFRCIWLDTPTDMKRNRRGFGKGCMFPFEPPTYSEGWDEIVIIRSDSYA